MLSEKILGYKDELFEDLNTLISIESIDGSRDADCEKALEFVLKRALSLCSRGQRTSDFSPSA